VTGAALAGADPILFDLDGTLTASGPGILASVRYALAELGEPIPGPAVLDGFIGPPLATSFAQLCGLRPERVEEAIRAYRVHYLEQGMFDNAVYEGIPEALDHLSAAGRTLAVATSKAEPYARDILDHFGLSDRFAVVVGSELDGRRTDKADVIAEALRLLGSRGGTPRGDGPGAGPATGPVMVGDRRHDVAGALAVGVPCIGALWGYGSADELTAAGATALVRRPPGLVALLRPLP
jgi:phosphoglycolate phosphatase